MGLKYLFVAIVASSITLFALQNNAPTSVRFLIWGLDGIPLATIILVSVAAGALLVGLPLWVDRWRLRSRARALEAQLASLEGQPGERERRDGPPFS